MRLWIRPALATIPCRVCVTGCGGIGLRVRQARDADRSLRNCFRSRTLPTQRECSSTRRGTVKLGRSWLAPCCRARTVAPSQVRNPDRSLRTRPGLTHCGDPEHQLAILRSSQAAWPHARACDPPLGRSCRVGSVILAHVHNIDQALPGCDSGDVLLVDLRPQDGSLRLAGRSAPLNRSRKCAAG